MRTARRHLHIAIGAIAALSLTACAGQNGGEGSTTGSASGGSPQGTSVQADDPALELFKDLTPSDDATTVDTAAYATDKEQLTVGYVDQGQFNSWRIQALESTRITAEKLGIELLVTDAGGDANKQISDAEDLLAKGVDALLVSPVSGDSIASTVERAYDAGIPVITWGNPVGTDRVTSKVITDDYFFGKIGGEKLIQDIGGTGRVIMLRGLAGNDLEQARYQGAKDVLDAAGIEVLAEDYGDWAFDQGKAIMENMLAAYPEIDGVWSSGAEMTRGAVEAFQEAGRELVPMSGENLNGFFKQAASVDLATSGPQFPTWQAPEALKLAVRALRGMPIESVYLLAPPAITDTEAAIVADASDDYWVEDYLTADEIARIFPN